MESIPIRNDSLTLISWRKIGGRNSGNFDVFSLFSFFFLFIVLRPVGGGPQTLSVDSRYSFDLELGGKVLAIL